MPWTWYGEPVWRYRDPGGRFAGQRDIWDYADASREGSFAGLGELADQLDSGAISLGEWQREMRRRLKQEMTRQYLAGRGGGDQLTPQDQGAIGGMLADQYRYLDGFARRIADGKHSPRQVEVISKMYMRSTREAFERAANRTRGLPDMPAYPGDGSTICLVNCQCDWSYARLRDRWEATWMLGLAEHCDDCLARSSQWSPLTLMDGEEAWR